MRASHKAARSTKGWRRRAPHLKSERKALHARCGAKAFLDPKRLKFPIMAKHGPCVPDCEGIRAAKSRAAQFHHRHAAAKAERLGKRAACHWAK
jgi:hypothetical protein